MNVEDFRNEPRGINIIKRRIRCNIFILSWERQMGQCPHFVSYSIIMLLEVKLRVEWDGKINAL